MNFRGVGALPPVQSSLPALRANGDGCAAIELPGFGLLQIVDPLLPSLRQGRRRPPRRHASGESDGTQHDQQDSPHRLNSRRATAAACRAWVAAARVWLATLRAIVAAFP